MYPLMPLQIAGRHERPRAARTHKRLVPAVDSHVLREVRVPREALAAQLTRVRTHTGVHDCVLAQVRAARKALLALGADKWLGEAVGVAQVLLEKRALVAGKEAEDAVVWLGGVVLGLLVLGAVLLVFEAQVAVLAEVEGLLIVVGTAQKVVVMVVALQQVLFENGGARREFQV